MLKINQITSDPFQTQRVLLPDGSFFTLTLYFRPMQLGWWITELTYNTFTLQGMRITNNPNILFQFQNQVPFGLACFTQGNREPSQIQQFSSGQSELYVLTAADVAAYNKLLQGGENTWNSVVAYIEGAVVTYLGITYHSLVPNNIGNLPTDTNFWSPV